jgi:hypothetical protein
MEIRRDGKGQPYIEWCQADEAWGFKKAWIQRKTESDKDWARTGRYLNVVRSDGEGRTGGNPTDFPIFGSPLSDEQILRAFVAAVCAITNCRLTESGDAGQEDASREDTA